MKPLLLRIRKKVKVPTKRQLVHQYRSDWKMRMKLSYSDTHRLFTKIGGGPVETDSQFAYFLYKELGEGIYSILAWRKGRKGFWSFWKVELRSHGFRRIKRNQTQEDKENERIVRDIRKLKKKIPGTDSTEERNELQEKIDNLKEEANFNEEISEILESDKRRGPYPYLKQTRPIYKFHGYKGFGNSKEKEVESVGLW